MIINQLIKIIYKNNKIIIYKKSKISNKKLPEIIHVSLLSKINNNKKIKKFKLKKTQNNKFIKIIKYNNN